MPKKNHTSAQYIKKFNHVVEDLHKFNKERLMKKRSDFAKKRTYEIRTKTLLNKIIKNS